MSGLWKFIIGVISLCILWFVTDTIKHVPIETELRSNSQDALASESMDWAKVTMNGRNAVLTGTPPSPEAGEEAVALIAGLHGVHSAHGDFDMIDIVSPYVWIANQRDGKVTLTGVVPSKEAKASLLTATKAKFPSQNVIDEMRIAGGVPSGNWTGMVTMAISQLSSLDYGKAQMRGNVLTLEGGTSSPRVAASIKEAFENVSAGYNARDIITVDLPEVEPAPPAPQKPSAPAAVIVPQEAQAEIDLCQDRIDSIMTGQTINFKTGSAQVYPQPNPLIMALAGVAKECPSARIVIAGHTDSMGDPEKNKVLSEARAKAIVNLLVDEEIESSKLSAEGFGASVPIADNSTPEGRRANRRIEFRVLYAGAQ